MKFKVIWLLNINIIYIFQNSTHLSRIPLLRNFPELKETVSCSCIRILNKIIPRKREKKILAKSFVRSNRLKLEVQVKNVVYFLSFFLDIVVPEPWAWSIRQPQQNRYCHLLFSIKSSSAKIKIFHRNLFFIAKKKNILVYIFVLCMMIW